MSEIKIHLLTRRIGNDWVPTPQCDAQRSTRYFNDRLGGNFQCAHSSAFIVDGQHLCTRHASVYVLQEVLRANGHYPNARGSKA